MKREFPSCGTLKLVHRKLFIILILCSITLPANAAEGIVDDLGREIHISNPAVRIISLYSAFNEILSQLHVEERLIARTDVESDNATIQHLPSIGTHMRPNLELIVGMGPDLVLQMGGRKEAVQSVYDLERLGITVAYFSVSDFDDLFRVIDSLGKLTGTSDQARELVDHMRARLDAVRMAIPVNHDLPTIFFEVRSPELLTVGSASMVSDIIKMAGGTNCIRSDRKLVRVSDEKVFELSPDYYIVQRGAMNLAPAPMSERPRLKHLSAVINNHWHVVDESRFSRPGPRNVDAVEQLARILYPEIEFPKTVGSDF